MHAFMVKASSPCQALSWDISGGDGDRAGQLYGDVILAHWPKSYWDLGVQIAMWLHRPVVQLITKLSIMERDGKEEKGSISPDALLLALVTTVVLIIFISSLQNAVQKTTQRKANTTMAK